MTTTTAQRGATATQYVTSADGTEIAYEVHGAGPALVIVDGALCQRALGPSAGLAKALAHEFSLHAYDRRGRGESGAGAAAWSVEREIEDLAAVIDAAGGSADVVAVSSGAVLVLEAARAGLAIGRIVLYEAAFILDDTHAPTPLDTPQRMRALVDEGRRGEAVKTFMRLVGLPAPLVGLMRVMPAWKQLTGIAHTLPYDMAMVVPYQQGRPLPPGRYDGVVQETLVLGGAKSPGYMRNAQAGTADALPNARAELLPGQTHMLKPKVVGPVAARFCRR